MYIEIHYLYELYQYTFHCISILLSLIMCIIIGYNQLHYASQSFQCDVHKIYSTHKCQEWLHIEIHNKCVYECTKQYHNQWMDHKLFNKAVPNVVT